MVGPRWELGHSQVSNVLDISYLGGLEGMASRKSLRYVEINHGFIWMINSKTR